VQGLEGLLQRCGVIVAVDLVEIDVIGAESPQAIAAITQLLDAGKSAGTIRADADPGDFLQLTGALWRAASGPKDRSQPMLGLILDGLSTPQRERRRPSVSRPSRGRSDATG
jgi:hypothetical protein